MVQLLATDINLRTLIDSFGLQRVRDPLTNGASFLFVKLTQNGQTCYATSD